MHVDFHFDWTFFKRFLKLCRSMFPSFCSSAVLMTVFLLLLSLLEQVIIYYIGLIPSQYYKFLGEKDQANFTKHTIISVFIILAEAFVKSLIKYVSSMLYITWRGTLCRALHNKYFSNIIYYHLNVVEKTIDNPDQRITQDVDRLTSTFSRVFVPLIISPFTIGYYMYQASVATGKIGPISVLVFFFIFTIFNKLLMSPVVHYYYMQERREGDFRFKHMQLRTHAESAAFYQAGAVEMVKTNQKLHNLLKTQRRLIQWQLPLNFSINSADYLGSILSYIAISFPIFYGQFSGLAPADLSALISKNAFVSIYLINCFTQLIDQANSVTDMAGTAHRIGQLFEEMEVLKAKQEEYKSPYTGQQEDFELISRHSCTDEEMTSRQSAFFMDSVTYGPPNSSSILCHNLTLRLDSGNNILVTGDSGCGKTSLLRILSGLWRNASGLINMKVKQSPEGIMYLPQKPYLTNGSLRDQIVFPFTEAEVVPDDDRIYHFLSLVGLHHLIDRLGGLDVDVDWNWYDELSPGETQRLSFVRLFFHQPPFAVLDEATSQVSQEMEATLYQKCDELHITVLSVGHRDSIRQFHHNVLQLSQQGDWSYNPISVVNGCENVCVGIENSINNQ